MGFRHWLLVVAFGLFGGAAVGQPLAAVRLAHLSPDAPQFDLVVDRQLFLRDVSYGQVTPYASLPAGQHEISVYPHRLRDDAGQGEEGELPALEPVTILVDLDEGMYYTLAVSGFYERPANGAASGELAVDVDPPEATVVVNGPRGFSRTFRGEIVLEGLEPGEYTMRAEHEGFQPATVEIEVRADETSSVSVTLQEGDEEVAPPRPEVTTEGATSSWRSIELHAFRDDLGVAPPPGGSRIRLLHLSPSTTAVDLLAIPTDGAGEPVVLASGLTFPNASAYSRAPGHEFTLQVRLAGTDAILGQVPDVAIGAGGSYTLFLVREPVDNYLRLIPSIDALISVRH